MPVFERGDKSGVYVEATRDIFKRGVRLDERSGRRIRDLFYTALYSAGMDPEDIARIFRGGVCPRQIRNRVDRTPPGFKTIISLAVFEAMKMIERRRGSSPPTALAERSSWRRRKRQTATGRSSRQLLLFPVDPPESSTGGSGTSTPS